MRSQNFGSLRTTHHKLLLRASSAFDARIARGTNLYRWKKLSRGPVLNASTIWKRRLGLTEAPSWRRDSRLSKQLIFWRLAVQGPKQRGLPATSGGSCLQRNIETFEAILRKGKGRKWVAFGISVKDGWDWMTPANNVGMWHRRVERSSLPRFLSWFSDELRAALLLRLDFSIVDTFAYSRMTSEYFYSPGFGPLLFRGDGVPTLLPQYGCRRKRFHFVGMHHYQSTLLADLSCHYRRAVTAIDVI